MANGIISTPYYMEITGNDTLTAVEGRHYVVKNTAVTNSILTYGSDTVTIAPDETAELYYINSAYILKGSEEIKELYGYGTDFLDGVDGSETSPTTELGKSGKATRDTYGTETNFDTGLAGGTGTSTILEQCGKSVYDDIDNLAGTGRTTETVKDNADDIATNANNISTNITDIERQEAMGGNAMLATSNDGQTMTDGTYTDVVFEDEVYDDGSNYDHTTGIYTAPFAGIYVIAATVTSNNVQWTQGDNIYLQVVGSTVGAYEIDRWKLNASVTYTTKNTASGSIILKLAASETVKIQCEISRGSNTTLSGAGDDVMLSIGPVARSGA